MEPNACIACISGAVHATHAHLPVVGPNNAADLAPAAINNLACSHKLRPMRGDELSARRRWAGWPESECHIRSFQSVCIRCLRTKAEIVAMSGAARA